MFYIFDQNGNWLASTDAEPDLDDLSSRGEQAIQSDDVFIRPYLNADGKIEEMPEQAVEISLENAKQALLSKIAAKTDRLKEVLTGNYPQTEIDSFYRQEQEARAFLSGENSTPEMLTSIAKIRNLPLELLAQAVVRKADKLAGVIGEILGQKQRLETKADNAKTLKALAKIEKEVEQWTL